MKSANLSLLLSSLSMVSASLLPAAEIISVNFWRTGGGALTRTQWEDLLTLSADDSAGTGDWVTTGWQNYELPWAPNAPQAAVTFEGTEGSTISFTLNDCRNGGPYIWNAARTVLVGNPDGNMMDGHANSTDDPGDGSNIFDIEITDIPFESYDVIVYLGANRDQFLDGTGKVSINGSPSEDFTLVSGGFDGTYSEITEPTTPGNYLVYRALGGESFSARVWGDGFTHLGPTGIQIVESDSVRQPLELADITYHGDDDEITLAWKSNPGEFYGVFWSDDLIEFKPGINPAVPADPEGSLTTYGPFPNPSPGSEKLYFRIGEPDLTDPTLDRVSSNGSTIQLRFSEAMLPSLATNPFHYGILVSDDALLPVESAVMGATPDTVILTPGVPLSPNTRYTIVAYSVTDLAGRPLAGETSFEIKTWDDRPNGVKVFILAGQSNMQGHGRTELGNGGVNGAIGSLRYETVNDAANYGMLVDGGGSWIARDDVKVFYRRSDLTQNRVIKKGNLLPEFGVDDARIGPELGFGWAIGDSFDEPVLIVKACWGGKSLYADFRSPSAVADRGGEVGKYYDGLIDYVHDALDNLATEFPEWTGRGYQIAGFGWHQGWNDGGNEFTASKYEENLADFIRDIRSEFGKPNLPFSLANTGINGASASGDRLTLLEGQLAIADPARHPEFAGNVAAADTRDYWRASNVSPLDQGFHWNQNGETQFLIGEAIGEGMKVLLGK